MFSELSYDSLNPGPSESFCDRSKDGTSSVTRLELFDCRAHPDGIEQILRWPKGLTEFYLEVTDNPSEFKLNFGEPTELELDIASILSRHQSTLWILCLTRPERNPHRLHLCIEPDFRSFVNLHELKVCYHFLDCYGEMTQEVHPILPISLVSLKVYYDPLEDSHFLAKEKKSEEWFLGIAEHRRDVHALKRVTIHSPGDSEEWEGVLYGMAEPKAWDVPLHLAQAFKRAEIQLLVLLLTIWDNKVPFGFNGFFEELAGLGNSEQGIGEIPIAFYDIGVLQSPFLEVELTIICGRDKILYSQRLPARLLQDVYKSGKDVKQDLVG
ncbi:MAG: hypothetical protein MMC33_009480 [Icmadophila ericetorum]|nr:hypothetical protein [Icmadophila ericetorum]